MAIPCPFCEERVEIPELADHVNFEHGPDKATALMEFIQTKKESK